MSIEGLEGTTGDDKIGGGSGADVLQGLEGNDTLYGGAGNDTYEFGLNHGQDVIIDAPYVSEDIIDANGNFNSALYTATWTDLGFGPTAEGNRYRYRLVITRNGTGEEVYRSQDSVDFIYTSAQGGAPTPANWPYDAGQWLNGASRTGNGDQTTRETLQTGNGGNDTIALGAGISLTDLTFTRLNSGADLQITYQAGNTITITGQNNVDRAIETLRLDDGLTADLTRLRLVGEAATADGDFMVGDTGANTLEGLGGNDVLSGLAGNDTLRGGDGDDSIEGGLGNDTIDGGNDSGAGDTSRYVRSNAAVTVNLETGQSTGGHAQGDTLVRVGGIATIENLVGSLTFNDRLTGDSRANQLYGLGGNDTLEGRGGNDLLVGGDGGDTLRGGDGNDTLYGDEGNDTLWGENGDDQISGGAGVDEIIGGNGNDTLSGGDDDDVLNGDSGTDILDGGAGLDQLSGGDDDDVLAGGEGDDTLYGGEGNDELTGGTGDDWLDGEGGDDTFVFDANSGTDYVYDATGENRVVINGATVDQIWITRSGDDLRIGVIGGASTITVVGYFYESGSLLNEIAAGDYSLFLATAAPLIDAMTLESADATPGSMPGAITALLGNHWFFGNSSAPIVQNQTRSTNEDTPLTGSVGAIDPDANIVSYGVQTAPTFGNVVINSTTGAWTYTPNANANGTDSFQILVTDADNQTAVQTVTVQVAAINDAPTNITLTGAPASITERDHPITGYPMGAIVLGTLSASDGDAGDSHVFSVSDTRFEIVNGNTLRLKAGVALDFEASPVVSVDVTVQDLGGGPGSLSYTKTFQFNVGDMPDYFYGTSGADTLTGQAGSNIIYGQGGTDTLTGGAASDLIDGGDGADTLSGLGGVDVLIGGIGADVLLGGDGDDALLGGADDDRLEGGAGDDSLDGDTGNDVLIGGAGADSFEGGDGTDTVSYETATTAVSVNLGTASGSVGDAAGDVFFDAPEVLIGSTFGDTLIGSNLGETIEGRTGDDTIEGGGGNDTLRGGEGNDTISAISGNDVIDGGTGNDTLIGGTGRDTYEIGTSSGQDEVRNFIQNGANFDLLEYQTVTRNQLWFQRVGDDLVISIIGTPTVTTLDNWFLDTPLAQRQHFEITFDGTPTGFVDDFLDVEAVVGLMAGYPKPANQPAFDTLHGTPAFEEVWRNAWGQNVAPVIATIASQIINEDGTLTLTIRVTDEFTPNANVTVTAQAVNPNNHAIEDLSLVYAPTVGSSNAFGDRTLTVVTKPNASGRVDIVVRAVDGGGKPNEQVFILNIGPVPDVPNVTQATILPPTAPATRPTFHYGSMAVNIQAALADTDGSETLSVRISGVPANLSFNAGSNLGGGVWSFAASELAGLRIQGPVGFSQNIQLMVTAIATESQNQQSSAPSTAVPLNIDFNAAPTDISASNLTVSENAAAGTVVGTFSRVDPDSGEVGGDAPTFSLVNSAGGLFSMSSSGTLTTNAVLNTEATGSYGVTVRVTDAGGLSFDKNFTITVGDVNEAPFFSGSFTKSIYEFSSVGTSVLTVAASDPDTNPAYRDLRYEILGSAGPFQINSANGAITVASVPNVPGNTVYNFNVRAWDGGAIGAGNSATTAVAVTVLDVDRPPTVSPAAIYVPENMGAGAVVGQISGSDPDGSLAYQLLAGQGLFNVTASGQVVALQNFNYETTPWPKSYYISVRTWDGGAVGAGHAYDASIVMWITDQPETPSLSFTARNDGVLGALVGTAYINDDDSGNTFTYEILSASQHVAEVWYQQGTPMGLYEYDTSPLGAVYFDNFGRLYCTPTTAVYDQAPGGWGPMVYYLQSWKLDIRVTDNTNRSSNVVHINFWGTAGQVAPIALDLDGDGVELLTLDESNVAYSMSDVKPTMRTGWIGKDDAFLALDRNHDGTIAGRSEISFIDDVAGATSDLEGLKAFDTNGDGSLNAGDARFAEFQVWQDANQDGISQAEELRSLTDRGIESISLTRNLTGDTAKSENDNVITATAEMRRTDGTVGIVGDVTLAYTDATIEVQDMGPSQSDKPANATATAGGVPQLAPLDIPIATAAALDSSASQAEVRKPAQPNATDDLTQPDDHAPSDATNDLHRSSGDSTEGWQYAGTPAQGALHASLDSVARRRLQMIDAMASFSTEGSATLDLQPHRRVDSRTLELLTAVGGVKSAA